MLSLHTKFKHKLATVLTAVVGFATVALAVHGIMVINGVFAYTMPAGFNDQIFYDAIVEEFKTEFPNEAIADSGLTDEQLAKITFLKHSGVGGDKISDTSGIEKLTGLETLDLQWNSITSVNLSENVNLKEINFEKNELTEIDLQALTNLEKLTVANNQLTSLDISHNLNLKTLYAGSNSLTSLDISNNTMIEGIYAAYNSLTSICVSNNATLKTLNVSNNSIEEIDASNATALKTLKIDFNQITSLNTTNAVELDRIEALSNQISSLDLSTNTELTYLDIDINPISSIDVSHNTKLKLFRAVSDSFTTLDFSNNPALETLYVPHNQLTSIDVSHNTNLKNFEAYENQITSLDLRNNTLLKTVIVYDNQLSTLLLPDNTTLTQIDAHKNHLTGLDVSQYTALTKLVLYNNSLTNLDVSANTKLTTLEVYDNAIQAMNIQNNTALTSFKADNIPVMMDVVVSETGDTTKYSLSNLKFLKTNQNIGNTDDYTYNSGVKLLTMADSHVDTANITSSTKGLSYQIVLPLYLAYNSNGGGSVPDMQICYLNGNLECTYHISAAEPVRDGYKFIGWGNSSGATTADYAAGGTVVTDDYKTIYALWAPVYELSFDLNASDASGTFEAIKCNSENLSNTNCDITLDGSAPTRAGYEFLGWGTAADAGTATYAKNATVTMSSDKTLYALWAPIYTLSFNLNASDASGTFEEIKCNSTDATNTNCDINLNGSTPTRTGYVFLGWGAAADATTVTYAKDAKITMDGDKTIYAVWSKVYTLSFVMNGGTPVINAKTCYSASDVSVSCELDIPTGAGTKNGYKFLGWGESGTATTPTTATKVTMNSDKTLYALWAPIYTLSFSLNASDASGTFEAIKCNSEDLSNTNCDITLDGSAPTRAGYEFLGWGTAADAGTATYAKNATVTMSSDKTLYALWAPIYTLSFNLNASDASGTFEEIKCNSTDATNTNCDIVLDGTVPTRTGYEFLGWSNTAAAITVDYSKDATVTMSGSKTIYGVWGNNNVDWETGKEFIKGETEGIKIKLNYPLGILTGILIDGVELSDSQYKIDLDNNTITIKPTYLDTLANGIHTIKFTFSGGLTVESGFEVKGSGQSGGEDEGDDEAAAEIETAEDGSIILDLTVPVVKVDTLTVNIYDQDGNLVKTIEIKDPNEKTRIDVSDLPNGEYTTELIYKDEDGNVLLVTTGEFVKDTDTDMVTITAQTEVDVIRQIVIKIYDEVGNVVRTIKVDRETGTVYIYDRNGNLLNTIENGFADGKLKVSMDGLESGEYTLGIEYLDENGRVVKSLTVTGVKYTAAEVVVPNTGGEEIGLISEDGSLAAGTISSIAIITVITYIAKRLYNKRRYLKNSL